MVQALIVVCLEKVYADCIGNAQKCCFMIKGIYG